MNSKGNQLIRVQWNNKVFVVLTEAPIVPLFNKRTWCIWRVLKKNFLLSQSKQVYLQVKYCHTCMALNAALFKVDLVSVLEHAYNVWFSSLENVFASIIHFDKVKTFSFSDSGILWKYFEYFESTYTTHLIFKNVWIWWKVLKSLILTQSTTPLTIAFSLILEIQKRTLWHTA